MSLNLFEIENIDYEREDNLLISNLSFTVQPGGFVYIAGNNGKGKTTLLKILAGILRPAKGRVLWQKQPISLDPQHFYRQMTYIGHKSGIDPALTSEENLRFFAKAYSLRSTVEKSLEALGLLEYRHIPAAYLSAGQIRRIALAKLFLLDTPLWLLDEPYTAMDNEGTAWLQQYMYNHLEKGGMIVMTSHQPCGIHLPAIQEINL